jgi:hypothetical protein
MKRHESGTQGSKKRKRKTPNSADLIQECSDSSQDSYKGKRVVDVRERMASGEDVEELANSPLRRGNRGARRPSPGGYRRNDVDDRRRYYDGDGYREEFYEPHRQRFRYRNDSLYSRSPERHGRDREPYGGRSDYYEDWREGVDRYRREEDNIQRRYDGRRKHSLSFDSAECEIVERRRPSPPMSSTLTGKPQLKVKKESQPKQLIEVDGNGKPVGKIFAAFRSDITVFSKELDLS